MNKINPDEDKDRWLAAIEKHGGMVTFVAAELGINRKTVARCRDEVEWVKDAFDRVTDELGDMAEKCIRGSIAKGNAKIAAWYLERKHKERGYGRELKVNKETRAKLIIKLPDNGRRLPATQPPPTEHDGEGADAGE